MDTAIADWLARSPQRATDAGEDLACVDQWLNPGLIDLGTDLGDDDIARSLEEFTGQEFFSDSPPPCAGREAEHVPQQQPAASSQPTSSGDGPTSSGAVCADTSTGGIGLHSRGGAFRSFSTNDLQLLLEQQQASLLPPVTGLSAPPLQYDIHMGLAGAKARVRPALESVPEGAPSPGGPLHAATAAMAIPAIANLTAPGAGSSGGGGESVNGVSSPALGASPDSARYLTCSAPEPPFAAVSAFAAAALARTGSHQAHAADSGFAAQADAPPAGQPAGLLVPETGGGGGNHTLFGSARGGGGGLRPVPSTGTLSALMNNTLSFQREGTDDSTQQQQLAPSPPQPPQQVQPPSPQQQQAQPESRQFSEGAMAAVAGAAAAAATPPSGDVSLADYGAGVAAATAAAVAAGMFPLGSVPGLAQPFALPPPAGLYGVAPHLYCSATSFPAGAYAAPGMPLPPPPAHMLVGSAAGAGDADAASAAAAATSAPAGGDAAVNTAGSDGCAPRLRKVQSALELGAWRSASLELQADAADAAAGAATGQKLIGRLTPEERLQRILRYRNKRNIRNFNREIKYQCRKTLADSRPRVGGRFARNDDPNIVLPHQTKKAMRMRQNGAAGMAVDTAAAGENKTGGSVREQQAVSRAAAQQHQQHQQELRVGVKKASSSSTASSTSSDNNQAAGACASSGAATASVASGGGVVPPAATAGSLPLGATAARPAPNPPHAASLFATACSLPYSYGMPGMPYTLAGLVPGGLQPPLPPPAGLLPHGIDAAALHHHYAVVNAAAQAAAQGVYAHLAMAPAAAPMQVHGLAGSAFGGGDAATATARPPPPPKADVDGADAGVGAALGLGAGLAGMPPRVGLPLVDALWTHLANADLEAASADAGAPAAGPVGAVPAGGATCMAVDG